MAIEKYKFHPKVVIRTPRKPILIDFDENFIKDTFAKKAEIEAIFLASPHLFEALKRWQNGHDLEPKEYKKLIQSLTKYFIRSNTRPTPFGLFSGVAIVDWGEHTNIKFKEHFNRHTRLDMNYLCELAFKLGDTKIIKERLKYYTNSSIYTLKNEYRYVEYTYVESKRIHQISAVKKNIYINKILNFVGKSGATYEQISQFLFNQKITMDEANSFIDQMIDIQLINSELEPNISGDEFIYRIIKILKSINFDNNKIITQKINILNEINDNLRKLDDNKTNEIEDYPKIITLLKELNIEFDPTNLFQSDLINEPHAESTIRINHQAEIIECIDFLQNIGLNLVDNNIQNFANKFAERYQEQEVKLSIALDTEIGIGYLDKNHGDYTPLIEGLHFGESTSVNSPLNKNQTLLSECLIDANRNNHYEIDLSKIKFNQNSENIKPMPLSFNVLFREYDNNKILIESIGGSSIATLLGRFGHVDSRISQIIEEVVAVEETLNNDMIFAEIVHLPENRTGNVLMHPQYRKYEIAYLASASVKATNQLHLDDLYLSMVDNRLVLRSLKNNKLIAPRLSNAHNYSNDALPLYQFLCDFQYENTWQYLSFDWGVIGQGYKFLPRVIYKNSLLSLATWVFQKSDFELVKNLDELKAFLIINKLPALFFITEGDNELLININNQLSLDVFFNTIKTIKSIVLKEYIEYSKNIIGKKADEIFANQFVASIYSTNKNLSLTNISADKGITRFYTLGSEWLYYKIYCGAKTADEILSITITKFLKKTIKKKLIKKWFFIRYNDPEPHLRIRFQLSDINFLQEIIQLFNEIIEDLIQNKIIWKLQTETYERELERYDFKSIYNHEKIFFESSNAILAFLKLNEGDEREKVRWLFGMKLIEKTLNLFNVQLQDKIEMLQVLKNSFYEEYSLTKEQKIEIDVRFRQNKLAIFEFMFTNEAAYDFILTNFEHNCIKSANSIIKDTKQKSILEKGIYSQIHMHINRLMGSRQRQHELLLYDFLHRYYKSINAKAKLT